MNDVIQKTKTLYIVEDNLEDFVVYRRLLAREMHPFAEIINISTLHEAIKRLRVETPDCCLMDYSLPEGSAADLIADLNKYRGRPLFPIVISTGHVSKKGQGTERTIVELMQLGAQDYLIKDGLKSGDLIHSLNNAMRTFQLQTELEFLAHHDPLTGLLNRALFMDRLEQAVEESNRYGHSIGLIYLDVDHFKQINDTYGHAAGDLVLKTIAERIRGCVRNSDSVARLGGDEFVVLLPGAESHEGHFVVQKMLREIPTPLVIDNTTLHISPSIGFATYPGTAKNHIELLNQADQALYKAKEQGRSQYVKFHHDINDEWQTMSRLARALPGAIQNGGLQLAYQPVFLSKNKQLDFVEAFVRWQHEEQWISPEKIMELVHQGALAIEFHTWLFEKACTQLQCWQRSDASISMSINMPANLFHNHMIIEALYESIKKHDIPPTTIIIEITETNFMHEVDLTHTVLSELSDFGVRIAIDDFGTGYSSLEYLTEIPCDHLKIDKRFIIDWDKNDKNQKVVKAITALAHQLGLNVVAEGVEDEHLASESEAAGCDSLQGFWLAKPVFGDPDWNTFAEKAYCEQQRSLLRQNAS